MNNTIIIILGIILLVLIILNHITIIKTTDNSRQGTCSQTAFGCCPDGVNSKINYLGTNCPQYSPGPWYPHPPPPPGSGPVTPKRVGGCAGTQYGCCPNGEKPKANPQGTNCN
jgi:hypothetical protein